MGIAYTGSGVMASSIAMDKVMTKRVWLAEGLPTPDYRLLRRGDYDHKKVMEIPDELGLPVIVKPAREGSSIGVMKVQSYSGMVDAVEQASKLDADVLCEQFIAGDEVTCPVMGTGLYPSFALWRLKGTTITRINILVPTQNMYCLAAYPVAKRLLSRRSR